INDSMTHDLDLSAVLGATDADDPGNHDLRLNRTLIIRAADDQRPVIRLAQPLRFRPANVVGATSEQQAQIDAVNAGLTVRLEGVYLTRGAGFPAGRALIERAALHSLEIIGCTLDPGGYVGLDGTVAP